MLKPIHHTFGPHITTAYLFQSWKLLLTPWNWRKGYAREALRSSLQYWFGTKAFLFSSGREGLLALLRSLNYETSSEILIQGYTCVALPNAIHAAGYTPVFVDTNPQTLNADISHLEGKITSRTKAVICQHTFGIVADTERLKSICNKHGLDLIEDCAHILPDVTGPKVIGKHGDYLMLSFGRDKAVSGISGGAIISKNDDVSQEIEEEEKRAKEVSIWSVVRLLLYPTIYKVGNLFYGIGLGKVLLVMARSAHLLIPVLTSKEKRGTQPHTLRKMPSSCAAFVVKELKNMHSINNHRRKLTEYYLKEITARHWNVPEFVSNDLPLQKFPILMGNADQIREFMKPNNIHLDDGWTGASVCPRSVDQIASGYEKGSCPQAEMIADQILTLPTHPTMTMSQAQKLVKILESVTK